jgi:hypothetical protein
LLVCVVRQKTVRTSSARLAGTRIDRRRAFSTRTRSDFERGTSEQTQLTPGAASIAEGSRRQVQQHEQEVRHARVSVEQMFPPRNVAEFLDRADNGQFETHRWQVSWELVERQESVRCLIRDRDRKFIERSR